MRTELVALLASVPWWVWALLGSIGAALALDHYWTVQRRKRPR